MLKFGKSSSSSDNSGGGIVLLSSKGLNGEDAGGIKLISKRPLEATYSSESLDGKIWPDRIQDLDQDFRFKGYFSVSCCLADIYGLLNESLSGEGQQFHQYQQNEQSPLT